MEPMNAEVGSLLASNNNCLSNVSLISRDLWIVFHFLPSECASLDFETLKNQETIRSLILEIF